MHQISKWKWWLFLRGQHRGALIVFFILHYKVYSFFNEHDKHAHKTFVRMKPLEKNHTM